MDHLQEVWEITKEWNAHWSKWKTRQFATLRTEDMESIVQDMFKKLHKLQRELKVSSAAVKFGFPVMCNSHGLALLCCITCVRLGSFPINCTKMPKRNFYSVLYDLHRSWTVAVKRHCVDIYTMYAFIMDINLADTQRLQYLLHLKWPPNLWPFPRMHRTYW